MEQLSPASAQDAFDQLVAGLARQHTRTRFRNHFGSMETTMDARIFARGTVLATREKPISHLLQEQPETVRATHFQRDERGLAASSCTEPSSVKLSDLLLEGSLPQALMVRGSRANLFVYVDPGADLIYVHRVVPEPPPKQSIVVKPARQSRKNRARRGPPE